MRQRWFWENMLWGGSIGWQLECGRDALLVERAGGVPLIIKRGQWSFEHQPLACRGSLKRMGMDPYPYAEDIKEALRRARQWAAVRK